MNPTRVLVVDDSPLIRQIVADMIRREPGFEVVGHARDGEEALLRIAETNPDVVTLDVDMPRLDGLACLKELMATRPVPVVMVSSMTTAGAITTLEALALGAVDFVAKPDNGSLTTLRGVRDELVEKVRWASQARVHRRFRDAARRPYAGSSDKAVFVAASTGGPRALEALLAGLPEGFASPMLVVQHLLGPFVAPLAQRLDDLGSLKVREARVGDRLEPGVVLLAPSGRHVTVAPGGSLRFDDGPAMLGHRPAADRLFRSAAETFGARAVAAVLSGMGRDGAEGTRAIRDAGGTVFAESEETSTIFGMPRAALEIGAAECGTPIDAMGAAIAEATMGVALGR